MSICMGACALRVVDACSTGVFKTVTLACALAIFFNCVQSAKAQVVQDFYEAPFATPTGVFEWDNFTTTFGSTPDYQELGIGSAVLNLMSIPQPVDAPRLALVTSTSNIYTGGTLTDFTVGLSGLDATEAHTTVVMHLAAIGSFTDFEINGQLPSEIVNLGTEEDVLHGSGAAPFDTTFYWAQWQLDSATDLEITFANLLTHQSLAGIRIDYFNSASPTVVPAPGTSNSTLLGDVNLDTVIDFSDIPAFISVLSSGEFQAEADIDGSGAVNFGDIPGFIVILTAA